MNTIVFSKRSTLISLRRICLFLFVAFVPHFCIAQDLLEQYIHSKGERTIVFNSSNIKQYWIDKSVSAKNEVIQIQLTKKKKNFESVPFKIQLANVTADQDCEVEVITENDGVSFQVSNAKNTVISNENTNNPLGRYHSLVSKFHIENTTDLAFFLTFSSTQDEPIVVKSIVLSFSKNNDFLDYHGTFKYNKDNLFLKGGVFASSEDSSMTVTGERNYCDSKNRFIIREAPLITSATIKNVGEHAANVQFGYAIYMQTAALLSRNLFPYKKPDSILNVISSEANSPRIVVDSYAEWQKGCFLALNAKDDFSDIPNASFANGTIVEITKNDDGSAIITMSEPQKIALKKGMPVRIHGSGTGSNIYFYQKKLLPGEEDHFDFSIIKNENALQFSSKALPKGTYYVAPFVRLYSEEKGKECSIQVSDYTISY